MVSFCRSQSLLELHADPSAANEEGGGTSAVMGLPADNQAIRDSGGSTFRLRLYSPVTIQATRVSVLEQRPARPQAAQP